MREKEKEKYFNNEEEKPNFFDKDKIREIFCNNKIAEKYSFSLDFICDYNNNLYKKTEIDYLPLKYNKQNGDINTEILIKFCSYFKAGAVDLSASQSIYRYYRHYGAIAFKELICVPDLSVVFNNKLIYLGKNFIYEGQLDKIYKDTAKDLLIEKAVETGIIENPVNFYFIKNAIYYNYNPNVDIKDFPTIYRIVKEWLAPFERWDNLTEEDETNIKTFFEIIGYSLLPAEPEPKIFLFTGAGRNGKSQAIHLIERIIEGRILKGNDDSEYRNIYSTSFSALKETHETANLKDKTLCIIPETDNGYIPSEIVKRLTGGDNNRSNQKYKTAHNFKPYCKLLIATNVTPKTNDFSAGHMQRYVFLDFNNNFDEIIGHKKINNIIASISNKEIEAFANYCLIALKNLIENNFKLSNEKSILEKTNKFKEKIADIEYYIEQKCIITEIDDGENKTNYIFVADMKADLTTWYLTNHKGEAKMPSSVWTTGISKLKRDGIIEECLIRYSGRIGRAYKGIKWKINPFTDEPAQRTLIIENLEKEEAHTQEEKESITYLTPRSKEIVTTKTKEYTESEIIDYLKKTTKGKIPEGYTEKELIRIAKKNNLIYEPRANVYKINELEVKDE